ncbi:hypothetical protein E0Z10_g8455 [Xylaria hypoxylon]|uniref:ABM domain-containing protein n=1 Tax=Xylaria hypoxylon TaxID=37992 RepID=A0A4Z0YB96_9PEZI|nr:hypothetical protein E0Z10_g8455 [Xylaria hypoxylon]
MAIIEIALPKLKRDAELIKQAEAKIVPLITAKLSDAGVKAGLRGFFVTENGRDVRDEFREILILEWPSIQHFKDFVVSTSYKEFGAELKNFAYGPPELKLFDADKSLSIFGLDTVVEYLVIKPKDASEASVQNALHKLQSGLSQLGASKVAIGSSSNLDSQEIALVSSYASDAELDTAKASAARQQLLADIAGTADVTSLVAHVKKELPLAGK